MQTEAENLRRAAEKKRAEEMLAEIENKKKLREYLDESKNAFDEYYGMGVRPLCGDYLHDIAHQRTNKSESSAQKPSKVVEDSSDEEKKE